MTGIGSPTTEAAAPAVGLGRLRQSAIYARGVFGVTPEIPTSWPDLDRLAKRKFSARAYGYVAGGAPAVAIGPEDVA